MFMDDNIDNDLNCLRRESPVQPISLWFLTELIVYANRTIQIQL